MKLAGKKIAIFLADIYEDTEYWYPFFRMQEEGAQVVTIGPRAGSYESKYGKPARANLAIKDADAGDHDALIIPGGYSPDHMRRVPAMVDFVKAMHDQGKPVAAICHAGWMLASADIIRGRRVTSYSSIRDDMVNAGGNWVDEEVVEDSNIITSRSPKDLPAFCKAIINAMSL